MFCREVEQGETCKNMGGGGGAPFVGRKDAKKGCASSVKALKRGARGVLSRVEGGCVD